MGERESELTSLIARIEKLISESTEKGNALKEITERLGNYETHLREDDKIGATATQPHLIEQLSVQERRLKDFNIELSCIVDNLTRMI